MPLKEHDPLARQHEDEPRFALLARDRLAPGLTRMWAALRARDLGAVQDIVNNLAVLCFELPYAPDKDPEHVLSARGIANDMVVWYTRNMPHPPTSRRRIVVEGAGPDTNAMEATAIGVRLAVAAGIFENGTVIELTQPAHRRVDDGFVQYTTGTVGTIYDYDPVDNSYAVIFSDLGPSTRVAVSADRLKAHAPSG